MYSFPRYLSAKKTVDDRALNRHVWQALVNQMPQPAHILEVGCGIGTMVERFWDHGLLANATYTAIDNRADNIATAKERLAPLNGRFPLQLETIDLFDFVAREKSARTWNLLIAHAFLDLMDIPATLPHLFSLLKPGSYFYFTLNFDGGTLLQPTIDAQFDTLVETLYHRTMDERIIDGRPSGDSQSGRHLFHYLWASGANIIAAGSSDWVVFAGREGYPDDEAYFLQFIIHTMHQALTGHPELDPAHFEAWIARRQAQIEAGELVYIAHQLDFLGRVN